jgi:hypothetical protein
MQIATTILQQLGGRKFIAMTGSHNFVTDGNTLFMTLRRNKAKAKWLRITLNSLDLYEMEFKKVNSKMDLITVASYENVYDDQLREIFTSVTGLETSL